MFVINIVFIIFKLIIIFFLPGYIALLLFFKHHKVGLLTKAILSVTFSIIISSSVIILFHHLNLRLSFTNILLGIFLISLSLKLIYSVVKKQ